jgi:hypothetical protein
MPVKKKTSQKHTRSIKITKQSLFENNLTTQQNNTDPLNKKFRTVAELLGNHPIKESNKYISQEFQAFGCHMATVLADQTHTSLYIKLAKTYPRALLEQALAFVSDAQNARSKAKLFMWKLDQLKKNQEEKKNQQKQRARKK